MRFRLVPVVAALAALATALPSAAAAPHIKDPKGDARGGDAGTDIVSASFRTDGRTSRVGGRTVYTPTRLLVTVTYAAEPSAAAYVAHQVTFTAPGCGTVYLQVYGTSTFGDAACVPDGSEFAVPYRVDGRSLTFAMPFDNVGTRYFPKGAALKDLVVYTSVADPFLGFESQEVGGQALGPAGENAALDRAWTEASYRIG